MNPIVHVDRWYLGLGFLVAAEEREGADGRPGGLAVLMYSTPAFPLAPIHLAGDDAETLRKELRLLAGD